MNTFSYNSSDTAKIACLLGLAISANLLELILPRIPLFPWLRLGLANAFLIAMVVLYSTKAALRFAVLRTLVSGLISGTPITSFLFSAAGGIFACLLMSLAWKGFGQKGWLGLAGLGMLGAIAHNLAQILVAYGLFVQHSAFLWQIPVVIFVSIVTGTIVGLIAGQVIDVFQTHQVPSFPYEHSKSSFGKRDFCGLFIFIGMIVAIFFVKSWQAMGIFYLLILTFLVISKARILHVAKVLQRFWGILFWIFFINALFTPGKFIFWKFSQEGLAWASILALRLVFCISASVIYFHTFGIHYLIWLFSKIGGGEESLKITAMALQLMPNIAKNAKKLKWRVFTDFKSFLLVAIRTSEFL